jgi:transposase
MIYFLTFDPLYNKVFDKFQVKKGFYGKQPLSNGLIMDEKIPMIDCQSLMFSPRLSESRMHQAQESFGIGAIRRLLCFALYLLGLNRSLIGRALGIPGDTAKSIIKAVNQNGFAAFEDRRRGASRFLPPAPVKRPPMTLREEDRAVLVDFGFPDTLIRLERQDPLQMRIVLLSMVNSGLLSTPQAADALQLTVSHTAVLARRLREQGSRSLVDQRKGQQQDFVVTPQVKAELVQQFAVDVITSGRTSSSGISEKLKERCSIVISERTVRHHLARMGLRGIKRSLPQLAAAVKKTSKNCSKS